MKVSGVWLCANQKDMESDTAIVVQRRVRLCGKQDNTELDSAVSRTTQRKTLWVRQDNAEPDSAASRTTLSQTLQ